MTKTPDAFVPGQGGGYRPAPVQVSQTHEVRAPYGSPAPATGRLSVNADGSVLIDAKSARLLPAGDNTIDLRQPVSGTTWHLDCRPGGLCPRRPNGASGGVRFRAKERVRLLLGCVPGPVDFEFRAVGNGLFQLYPLRGDK